jgi:hypothetical protein
MTMGEWIGAWFEFVRRYNKGSEVLTNKSKLGGKYLEVQEAWKAGYRHGQGNNDKKPTKLGDN